MANSLEALGRIQTLWAPRASQIARSEMAKFIASVGGSVIDYRSFHAWSASDLEGFWGALWTYARIVGRRGGEIVRPHHSGDPGLTVFFPKAKLNLAENILRGSGNRAALKFVSQGGSQSVLTIEDLRRETSRLSDGLSQAGVGPGDVVVSTLRNSPERIIAFLACAACGAVWAQLPGGASAQSARQMIGRLNGRAVFADAADSELLSAGKNLMPENSQPDPGPIVVVGDLVGHDTESRATPWASFGKAGVKPEYQRIGFNDPAVILFDCDDEKAEPVLHSVGGTLLTHLKEHILHGDLKEGDVIVGLGDHNSRLWLWHVSAMACGAMLVLADSGEPSDSGHVWSVVEACEATHTTISSSALAVLRGSNDSPSAQFQLRSLRTLFLIGDVSDVTLFDWVYSHISPDVLVCPLAGSEQIMANYFIGSPLHPVRRGEYSALALGMALYVVDDRGRPIIAHPGELVCCEAFPTMPLDQPFGDAGAATGAMNIGRSALITCYGAGILPASERRAETPLQRTEDKLARQNSAVSVIARQA